MKRYDDVLELSKGEVQALKRASRILKKISNVLFLDENGCEPFVKLGTRRAYLKDFIEVDDLLESIVKAENKFEEEK